MPYVNFSEIKFDKPSTGHIVPFHQVVFDKPSTGHIVPFHQVVFDEPSIGHDKSLWQSIKDVGAVAGSVASVIGTLPASGVKGLYEGLYAGSKAKAQGKSWGEATDIALQTGTKSIEEFQSRIPMAIIKSPEAMKSLELIGLPFKYLHKAASMAGGGWESLTKIPYLDPVVSSILEAYFLGKIPETIKNAAKSPVKLAEIKAGAERIKAWTKSGSPPLEQPKAVSEMPRDVPAPLILPKDELKAEAKGEVKLPPQIRTELINKIETDARELLKKDEFSAIPIKDYKLTPTEQRELVKRGMAFDADRMGNPLVRISRVKREQELRDAVKAKQLLESIKKPSRVTYHKGSVADAVRAAKKLKSDHDLYVFPTAEGMLIDKNPPPFGIQHIIIKPDGSHQIISKGASFEAGRKAEQAEMPEAEKTISQFTQEYKEGLGEEGAIRIDGVEVKPKVVVPGTKDVALLERGLGALHVADRHPVIAPVIKTNIKAEQNANHWIHRYSDRVSQAFDKVESPSLWQNVFGRKGTDLRDIDLMVEGKKPVPAQLTEFVTEVKGVLGDIKGEIIQKMKDDFADSLFPKQKEYLDWVQNGKVGDKPKYVRAGTVRAVDEAFIQFEKMESWGIQDYFPHIFKGKYKYLDKNGGIIASGQTAKQAKANFEEFIESHPETTDQTFMFVNDFYDLLTVRKTLNPDLVNPLEYLGTRLSRKEFFWLVNRTEKVIKEEIVSSGAADIPKVRVDMSGIASFQKGTKYSGHFLKRETSLRGEETDPFRAMMSYIFSVGRKLGLEDAKKASYAFADSLPANMPNAKSYIKMQADNMSGRYNVIDRLFDETIGTKLGAKSFAVSRMVAKGVGWESKLKLGYAPAKTAINRIGGVGHIILQEGVKNYIEGKRLLSIKDPDLMGRIEKEGHLAGMEQLFAGEGLLGVAPKEISWWRPLGRYQRAEIKNRSEGLAAGYAAGLKKFKGDKDAAWIYAIDSTRLTQGLYNTAAKPVLVRGPAVQASYQFKQYLTNEIRFMSQLTPAQWAGYIPGMVAIAGTRGALLTIKSIIGVGLIGVGIDELAEKLNRKAPHLHRGVFGLVGIDISAPASWQIPSSLKDWMGPLPKDIYKTGEMIIKGLQNNGWTDEEINGYIRQLAPVAYNVYKGMQILSEGKITEGSKTIYKGDEIEGVINFMGARSVSQSRASDSARYMNQQRRLLLQKEAVLKDKFFNSRNKEEAARLFKELVELKNIQDSEEMSNFIRGLQQSAQQRQLTEEARIFLTLPRKLKREESETNPYLRETK